MDRAQKRQILLGIGWESATSKGYPSWMMKNERELLVALRKTFNRPRWRDLSIQINQVLQKPDESAREFLSRLRFAIRGYFRETQYQ